MLTDTIRATKPNELPIWLVELVLRVLKYQKYAVLLLGLKQY